MEKNFSISDAVSFGWNAMKTNLGFFIPTVLIFWVAGAIPGGIQSLSGYMSTAAGAIWSGLFGLVSFVVGIFINIAQVNIGLKFVSGETADFPDLVEKYHKFLDVLVGGILYFLIVLGGLILLIIPGIYWAIRYQFFAYLIIDRDMGPVDAIKRSGQLTRGVWWHLFGFWWTVLGINILGFLACCVGALFAIPVIIVAYAYIYRTLLAVTPEEMQAPPQLPPQPAEPASPAQ
jgi:uncharacterized membrane protein